MKIIIWKIIFKGGVFFNSFLHFGRELSRSPGMIEIILYILLGTALIFAETLLIGGIWHGANFTFIVWGALHGIASVIHRFWKKFNLQISNITAVFSTFVFINLTWVFFRSGSIHRALEIIKSMCGFNGFAPVMIHKMHFVSGHGCEKLSIMLFLSCFILVFFFKNSIEWTQKLRPNKTYLAITLVLLITSILSLNTVSEFLYFQF